MYKWDAEDYHKSSAEQQKWAKELLSKLSLKGDESILDIGCGDGKITAEIANLLPHGLVVGIDNSEEMINFAKEKFPKEKYPNLTFILLDARNLINNEFNLLNKLDVVFSNAALHWVVDHLPVLEGIKKCLKPSGKILLQMGGKGNASEILEVIDSIKSNEEKWNKYFENFSFPYGFYDAEEYSRLLESVGLSVKKIELIPKDMVQIGKEGLAAWIRTTWLPYIQRVPENLRDEFINEIVTNYIETHPLDNEGFVHIKMMRLEVEAENKLE